MMATAQLDKFMDAKARRRSSCDRSAGSNSIVGTTVPPVSADALGLTTNPLIRALVLAKFGMQP